LAEFHLGAVHKWLLLELLLHQLLRRHQLVGQKLHNFAICHLLIIMGVNDAKKRVDVFGGVVMVLYNDVHVHYELPKLILINYAVFILIDSFEEAIEFGEEPFVLFKLKV